MKSVDIDALLARLSIEEKAALTVGRDMWTIAGNPGAGIPDVTVTDGPNGARGNALLGAGRVTAACLPCGSALGATWDPELVVEVGSVLGEEARTKGARFLLAPTINLHRSPLAGRNFECYSEDPLLSGRTAAAFVRGVQGQGVAATPKHLIGNESEFERTTISSDISERALRELYLVPFEHAVRHGGALAVMTSYNRLNGEWCANNPWLLTDILRDEYGFEGIVMTDWLAVAHTVPAALAGLDLQMPGPARFYGKRLASAVEEGTVPEEVLDAIVRRWLGVIDRLGAWDDPPATETADDRPEHRAVARRAASDATVLLRNDGVLPLDPANPPSVALIGPTAGWAHIMGGGSAQLKAHYRISPLEVLSERLGDRLVHEPGCIIDRSVRPLGRPLARTPDGEPGVAVEYFASPDWTGEPAERVTAPDCRLLSFGPPAEGVDGDTFSFRARCTFVAAASGTHTLTLIQAGRCRLLVNGAPIIDGIASPLVPGKEFFGFGSEEVEATIDLDEGQRTDVEIEYSSSGSAMFNGVKVGYQAPAGDDLIDRAVAAAAVADVAIVVVGTSDEWESEGHDRESMNLPGDQDELVRRVCAANARTVVAVNAGSPVTMDWADDAAAVLQIWLGGQEMAAAFDEVLFGAAEPAGRLPFTIPIRLEHNPSYGNFPGENHHVAYGEDLLIGYRWYDTRQLPVRFPFGHGGSYTTFEWGEPSLSAVEHATGTVTRVEVPVTNTGSRAGAEVVQCYVVPPPGRLYRPRCELKGFAKLQLGAGESGVATIELGDRAFAYWDPGGSETEGLLEQLGPARVLVPASGGDGGSREPGWYAEAGTHQLAIARSVTDVVKTIDVEISATSKVDA